MTPGNGQYEIKESFYHLDLSCRTVAEKFGKPDFNEWTNGDYIRLSSRLSRTTSVQISPNTLKRIFGKLKTPERYYPQRATRDALVQFIGYKDWDIFVADHPKPVRLVAEALQPEPVTLYSELERKTATVQVPVRKRKISNAFYALLLGAVLLFSALLYFAFRKENVPSLMHQVSLTCKNPEGRNPHSAVFSFQLPDNFDGDPSKFTVNFGDGRAERKLSDGVVFTHYYEIPGRYYAVLKYDNTAADTIPIYLRTEGWTATATVEGDSIRVYPVPRDSLFVNKYLSASAAALKLSGVDTAKTFFVEFANTRPTEISGDNFELAWTAKSSFDRPGVRCSQISTVVYGQSSYHKLLLMKPGCEAWSNLTFSDYHRDGRDDDLGFLAADFSAGGKLLLRVSNKKVSLFFNGSEVYKAGYSYSLGKIYGIKIGFAGIGEIHNVTLKDLSTGATFNNSLMQ